MCHHYRVLDREALREADAEQEGRPETPEPTQDEPRPDRKEEREPLAPTADD